MSVALLCKIIFTVGDFETNAIIRSSSGSDYKTEASALLKERTIYEYTESILRERRR